MDSEFGTEQSEVIAFLRKNIVVVLLGLLGLMFLGIGLIQFLTPQQKIEVLSAVDTEALKDHEKVVSSLVIDIAGAVKSPGVYEFPEGSRIKDAIMKAGGFAEDADRARISQELNLAQALQDGVKVYIPKVGDTKAQSTATTGKVNINTASDTELEALPGVGSKTVEKIVSGRPYAKIEELLAKKIVGQATFEKVKDSISVY